MDQLDFGEPDFDPAPREVGPARQPEPAGSPRFKFINREQNEFRVFALDELIEESHPARAIWDFLGRVDLAPFEEEIRAVEGRAGQATFAPQLLAALWIYGYSQGIGSAREIARCCSYHPGFRWLCGDDPVNYHTLSDFRVKRESALRSLLVDVLAVLSHERLVTLQIVAHDGSKIRAVAGEGSLHRQASLTEHLEAATAQVTEVERESEKEGVSERQKGARRRAAAHRQEQLERAHEQLEQIRKSKKKAAAKAQARVSETEPEARMMKMPDGGFAPAYNAQVSTDGEAGIIVNADLTNVGSDFKQLVPSLEQVKESFGKLPDQVLADAGFVSRENIMALDGRTDLIGAYDEEKKYSEAQRQRQGIAEEFAARHFVYDGSKDQFQCPADRLLVLSRSKPAVGKVEHYYTAAPRDCQACAHRPQCCPKSRSRSVLRIEDDVAVERFREKMQTEAAKQLYKLRSRLAEFPFCWLKEKFGLRRFHVRGVAKARMELWWATLAYNIQRWTSLRWQRNADSLA